MTRFPKKEADISRLAYTMINGYAAHIGEFPSVLPVGLLMIRLITYNAARNQQTQARSAVHLATKQKNASLKSLCRLMKGCLKKSQADVADDPEKLAYIGWGPRAAAKPAAPPAAPGNLASPEQGQGTVTLTWQSPSAVTGGPVRNYIIERRLQQAGGEFSEWAIVETSLGNTINLTGQPRGTILEYRVRAVNSGGEGTGSNTVSVVL